MRGIVALVTLVGLVPGFSCARTPTTNGAQSAVAATASVKRGDRVASGVGLSMVYVDSQTFVMGSPKDEAGYDPDETQHTVTITKGYWLGESEVTQKMWREVMGTEPWKGQPHVIEGDTVAATYMDWDEAVEFCRRLTLREGQAGRLPPGYEYCLPTEAEWELACRAGTTTPCFFGSDVGRLGEFAVYRYTRDGEHAHTVKSRKANGFGFFDIYGNVWEWCADARLGDGVKGYPDGDGVRDPWSRSGSRRTMRGCGFYTTSGVTSAIRRDDEHGARTADLGFRPALAARSVSK